MSNRKALCLNMIVKNEMANLERCLTAVAPHIDCWVIGDTGSSDGTQDFIMAFFAARGLTGELHNFPFENFEQARNAALDHAYASPLAYDYILFCDADMELVVDDADFRERLTAPGYQLNQRTAGGLTYWNARLARRDAGVRYYGVTHEYLDVPGGAEQLHGVWYKDHASGANRTDKFERDIKLLTTALEQEPGNHRYWFYLAQSYRDCGRTAEAAAAYAKRVEMGGWEEEAWYAQMMRARCLRDLGDDGGFLREALAAFNRRPSRSEPLYDLAKYYRERSMNEASVLFSEPGLKLPRPNEDVLFLEDFVYTPGLKEEYSIAANYVRDPARKDRGFAVCNWLALNRNIPARARDLARRNLFFYLEPASALMPSVAAHPVGFTPPKGYRLSNPSVARQGGRIVMGQPTVNYTGVKNGKCETPDGALARTRSFLLRLNEDLEIRSASEIMPPENIPEAAHREIRGFEDMRLFAWREALWCSATVQEPAPEGWRGQIVAQIDERASGECRLSDWHELDPAEDRPHEKNWVPQIAGDTLSFVCRWDPTRVLDEVATTIAETTPTIAADQFSGGSQAVAFDNGWLALIHEVSERDSARPYCQHRFVWLDAMNTLSRVSRPFFFNKKGGEYAAGLAWHPDEMRLLISYGIDDSEAWIATVEADEVRAVLDDVDRLPSGEAESASFTPGEKKNWIGSIAAFCDRLKFRPNAPLLPVNLRSVAQMLFTEKKVYSQNGEDGVIGSIFDQIGAGSKFYVEIGCEDGRECNTRKLSDIDGWTGVRIGDNQSDETAGLYKYKITRENVCETLRRLNVPSEFDLISIDIDFNDFHVLSTVLTEFSPRVIVTEYNSSLGPSADLVVPYLGDYRWDGTNFFGASYNAFRNLGKFFGYAVVYCESQGVNLFMVRQDVIGSLELGSSDLYRPPRYGTGSGHPIDHLNRKYLSSEHYLLPGVTTRMTRFGVISYFQNDVYIGGAFTRGVYWDEDLLEHVSNRLAKLTGVALDIGAHVGSHSVALAYLNPSLRFVCFEPQLPLFLLLERNIHENGLSGRFEALNAAVGHAKIISRLSSKIIVEEMGGEKEVEYGGSSAINLGGMQLGPNGEQCEVLRIDDLALGPVRYIKVDVEGAEPLVFYGMQQLLTRDFPLICFEDREDRQLSPETWNALGVTDEIREFSPRQKLLSLGYKIEKFGLDYIACPPTNRSNLQLPARAVENDTIPKCIFQTWKSKREFPPTFSYWLSTFDGLNPSFEHIIWDDDDNHEFIASEFEWFLPTYRGYPREIYRADAIRYFYLYSFGGFYADMDAECLQPLDRLLARGDVVLGRIGSDPNHPHSIPNAIMASRPKQEFWLLVIWLLLDAAGRNRGPEFSTGPVVLKSAVELYLARDPQWVRSAIEMIARRLPPELRPEKKFCHVEILPSYEWFPIDWTDPVHQRLRRQVLTEGLLSEHDKRELFTNSSMVTYWSHTY